MSVMRITILRDDLYNNPTYIGAHLCLPATTGEIKDALERARVDAEHDDYSILDYDCEQDFINEVLPAKVSLYELDYLARRLFNMDDYKKAAFEGIVKMEKDLDLTKIINLTYNLDNCNVVFGVHNDKQLGKFYVDNELVTELEKVPEEVLKYIDYEKVGRIYREAERGIFTESGYVVQSETSLKTIYDGTKIFKPDDDLGFVFKLYLKNDCFEPEGVWLELPAPERKIKSVLSELGVTSFDECIVTHYKSSIPFFDNVFSINDEIDKLNILSNAITKIINNNMNIKYKAALQYEQCTDLNFAIDIAQNLNCYNFYPSLSSPEDYGRQALLEASKLSAENIAFKFLSFRRYGEEKMKQNGVQATGYGLICRNGEEFVFEFCQRSQEHKMGGM